MLCRFTSFDQFAEMWPGRTTEFGERPDGSVVPLDDVKAHALVTPQQGDARGR